MAAPPAPLTFTKFPSSIAGPTADVPLSGEMVDWEVEIVVVIGRTCAATSPVDDAWDVVAGLTLGQDISDRRGPDDRDAAAVLARQELPGLRTHRAGGGVGRQLGRSRRTSALWCDVSGERMQDSRTTNLIFSIPTLVAYLSSICTLEPGDLIFTGTPDGVGMARGRFLAEGDVIVSGRRGHRRAAQHLRGRAGDRCRCEPPPTPRVRRRGPRPRRTVRLLRRARPVGRRHRRVHRLRRRGVGVPRPKVPSGGSTRCRSGAGTSPT